MSTRFRPYSPDQDLLLPVSLRDWLPEDHLAYFVAEMIEELDLTPFYEPYMGDGRRKMPYEPSKMLEVLVYAYISGVFSSRKVACMLGLLDEVATTLEASPDSVLVDVGYRKEDDPQVLKS